MNAETKKRSPIDITVGLFALVAAVLVWSVTVIGLVGMPFVQRRVDGGDWFEMFAFALLASGLTTVGLYFGRRNLPGGR